MIIPLHEEDFDLLMNRGFYYGTKEYEQYIEYNNIRGNMQRIAEICGANEKLVRELESRAVAPVAEKHNELLERFNQEQAEEEKIRAMFADVGQVGKVVGNGQYINGKFVTDEELEEIMKENAQRETEEEEYQEQLKKQLELEKADGETSEQEIQKSVMEDVALNFSGAKWNETDYKLAEEAKLQSKFLNKLSKILKDTGQLVFKDEKNRKWILKSNTLKMVCDSENNLSALVIEKGGQISKVYEYNNDLRANKEMLMDFVLHLDKSSK